MSDSFITVVIILIAAVLIFVTPIVSISARNDRTATQNVQSAVTTFVDNVRETRNDKERRLQYINRRNRLNR